MRTLRSLRQRAQTGLRRSSAEHRRRVGQVWRDLGEASGEIAREVSRRYGPLEPRRAEIPVRIRDH